MGSQADQDHATCSLSEVRVKYQAEAAYSYMPVFLFLLWVLVSGLPEMRFAYWLKHR
jgi:hypothetical protein